jgi:hypothetical protein
MAVQRSVPGTALGRVSAVFLTAEAAATLGGAVIGPALAQSLQLSGVAVVGSLATLGAAALTLTRVPRMPRGHGTSDSASSRSIARPRA